MAFTGFNPSMAKSNIEQFNEQAYHCYLDLGEEFYEFFAKLSAFWASNIAVDFGNTYEPKATDLVANVAIQFRSVVRGAVAAYNIVAVTHGAGTIDEPDTSYTSTFGDFVAFVENKDGIVGMDVDNVVNVIVPEFTANIQKVVARINSLPNSIALYDDEDGQRHAYATKINEIAGKIEGICAEIVSSVQASIETETHTILLAKQSATETLNGQ